MRVPDQHQLDYLASLSTLLSRSDPVAVLPAEPADRVFDRRLWRALADTGALGFYACPAEERDPFSQIVTGAKSRAEASDDRTGLAQLEVA